MEDRNESLQKIFAIARIISVYLFLIFLLLLNAAKLPVFDLGTVTPYFLLMGVYYWLLARPTMLPFYLVFVFGLALDFITGEVVGLNALCFLLISFVLYGQRRFLKGQAWPVLWAGYGLACAFVACVHMIVFILMNWSLPGFFQFFAPILISVLAYPLITIPMIALNKLFRNQFA